MSLFSALRVRTAAVVLAAIPLVLLGLGAACAGARAPQPTADAPETAQAGAPEAAEADAPESAAAAAVPQGRAAVDEPPPGAEVLVGDDGIRYWVDRYEKVEGQYLRLGDGRVQTVWGIPITVVDEDDDYFYFKRFMVDLVPPPSNELSEEEVGRLEESYRSDLPAVDRVGFLAFSEGLPATGQWRHGFALADMNGDGHLDILHAPPRGSLGGPAIILGDGRGGWQFWPDARFPPIKYGYGDAAAADFDGDGNMDVALAMHETGVQVLVGDGAGSFREWSRGIEYRGSMKVGDTRVFSSRAIEVLDWNRDGRPDVAVVGEGPLLQYGRSAARAPGSFSLRVYLNNGDGTWETVEPEGKHESFGDALGSGDFDGDGWPDLVYGSNVRGGKDILAYGNEEGRLEIAALPLLRPQAVVRALDVADFDGDGRDDIAIGYLSRENNTWRTGIDVFSTDTAGTWRRLPLAVAEENREGIWALTSGDLDGDGGVDLVAFTRRGEPWVFLGDGRGGFSRQREPELGEESGCTPYAARLGDLDSDGRDEVVVGVAGEPDHIFAPQRCTSRGALLAWDVEVR